jgi:hypothetical protein
MKTKTPTTPIQRPATRLEQERDQMLVALDRAVAEGDILGQLPVVQRANWSQDGALYTTWLSQLPVWQQAIEDTLKQPLLERGRGASPLLRKGEAEFYPDGERIALLAAGYYPNDPVTRNDYCDLPEGAVLFTDDELQTALLRVRQIIANPPVLPAFEVSGKVAWSPKIGRSKYADMSVVVTFPGPLALTPKCLNQLFVPTTAFEPNADFDFWREVELYIWACPQQFSLSSATRLRAELEAINHPFSPRPLEMHVLTADLAHLDQLIRAKIGVIAYDQDRDTVYIPEAAA